MDKKKQLINQIKVVINNLENDYYNEITSGVLQLIYKRYKNALTVLENNKDIRELNIIGGIRAYMDSYSDYQNPLLGELHKAEKLNKELL
ncbi:MULTISPECIES: hypothetical protein [Peribacillus]|uniref:Bacteriocin immunity protein n=1 Tax=Peribacillus simplex TaxID=1478 RepID=A0A9X8RCI6_9BACI|nr:MULTISPECIES: hypothetical protein [Peribacillus]MED4693177.1 hypothetical protein [Peribacillus frigoritolerans]PRS36072.1 hypothetical protein C6W19_15405 [Bacillus sp. RJGP41]TFH58477.1 hypothetical protein E4J71_24660 [Peribacillus frigoritolerans]SIR90473.1 hypothetical protein SAMN05878482_1072 [Peribacillus simplex]